MPLQSTAYSYRSRRTDRLLTLHTDSQPSIHRRTIYIPPDSEEESEEEDEYGERGEREEREEREESVAMLDAEGDERAGRPESVALLDWDAEIESLESLESLESVESPLTSYPRHTHLPAVSPLSQPLRAETQQDHQARREGENYSEDQGQDAILLSDDEEFEQVIDTLRLGSPPTTHWNRHDTRMAHHDHTSTDAAGIVDEDGDVLAMLLQRQQKMREDQNQAESEQVGAALVESGLPAESESSQLRESQKSNSSVDRVEETIDSPVNRR
jgi:hypothetical protein